MNEKIEDIEEELTKDIKENIKQFKDVKPLEGDLDIDDFRKLVVRFPTCFFVMSDDKYTDVSGENNRKFRRDITWDFYIGVKNLRGIKYRKTQAAYLLRALRILLVSDKWEFIPDSSPLVLNLEGGSVYLFKFYQSIYWSRDYQES